MRNRLSQSLCDVNTELRGNFQFSILINYWILNHTDPVDLGEIWCECTDGTYCVIPNIWSLSGISFYPMPLVLTAKKAMKIPDAGSLSYVYGIVQCMS